MERIQIVGGGFAGLAAAITLAKRKIPCNLISAQASERSQSALAEGGINAALDTMGEGDSPALHMEDTLRSGAGLSDPEAVRGMTGHAPEIVRGLADLGVPFAMADGRILLRGLGGHTKKRTVYAKSSTGKMILTAMIDEARKYEASDALICRFPHHNFLRLLLSGDGEACEGVVVRDDYSGRVFPLYGPTILAFGGLNGMFPGETTGSYANSADAAATVFAQGVRFGNLEMIQYHPTTIGISGKRMLISEAARAEGGRLYIERGGAPWYFMEEKYPERGNLMPRDVVSRECSFVLADPECGDQIYLDMRSLPAEVWKNNISDLREEVLHYMNLDPITEPIPVKPGIHYFMGGVDVDVRHRTNLKRLYAAGECCDQYHGANRLGGNSALGALYGGGVAALQLVEDLGITPIGDESDIPADEMDPSGYPDGEDFACGPDASAGRIFRIRDILLDAMGIIRDENGLRRGLSMLEDMENEEDINEAERRRICLAKAMILSALLRTESRGAHFRQDDPTTDPKQQKRTVAYGKDRVFAVYKEEN